MLDAIHFERIGWSAPTLEDMVALDAAIAEFEGWLTDDEYLAYLEERYYWNPYDEDGLTW